MMVWCERQKRREARRILLPCFLCRLSTTFPPDFATDQCTSTRGFYTEAGRSTSILLSDGSQQSQVPLSEEQDPITGRIRFILRGLAYDMATGTWSLVMEVCGGREVEE
jgi:hypothetical protein